MTENRYRKMVACAECGNDFHPWRGSMPSRFCSYACRDAGHSRRMRESWPSEEELRALYVDENLTDREIGVRLGRSAAGVLKLRRHYGIAGRPAAVRLDGERKHPLRYAWSLRLKGEFTCRSCGGEAHHLHHIVPRSKTRRGIAEVSRNGMPLCAQCHRGWHDGRLLIFRDRLQPQELAWAVEHAGPVWVEARYPYRPDVALRRNVALSRGQDPDTVEDGASEGEALEIARMVNEYPPRG